jgi:hypothetical protein
MPAFQVSLSGRKLCTAGVGDHGVLTTMVTWVRRKGGDTLEKRPDSVEEELSLHVGGLITPKQEHVGWVERPLKAGDEVRVKIVEAAKVGRPRERRRRDPAIELRSQKKYCRMLAKKFGWKIVAKG